ncbi:MAG: site-specific DNA-methyltransferase [Treponema sp.]|nr:site-specific DNA-methyltransferase [Treponema sp.]
MSTNISGEKRQALLSKIAEIKSFIEQNSNDKNASQLISYLGDLTREVNGKKYGLVFEEHREAIDEKLEQNAPVFTEEKDLFIDNGGELNFLLEGDNLASLKLLEKTHRGKIDVIYIDPPYNTGNKDFIYDDDYVDSVDQFRHSKWLSFMEKRLQIARNLLSEKGVIFISIDDNEQSDLKLLCDEVFNVSNFICSMVRKTKSMTGDDGNGLNIQYEYVLIYGRNKSEVNFVGEEKTFEGFSNPDNDPNGIWCSADPSAKSGGDSTYFPITNPYTGLTDYPPEGRYWAFSKDTLREYIRTGRVKFKETYKKNQRGFIFKRYAEKMDNKFMPVDTLNFANNDFMNSVATTEVNNILGAGIFSYPKPVNFIQKLIQFSTFNSQFSTVLDFFAGSGTTGHAVLKLNAEDGGHRKFILCTNNENNICRDITYQRLKTVITGTRKDGSTYSDGLPGSLKYFKTDFIPISEKMYYEYADDLLFHVRELVELENAVNFDKDKTVAIVLDDDEMEEFIATLVESGRNEQKDTSTGLSVRNTGLSVRALYVGHDVLVSGNQERILKSHNISINTIPDYYYRDLAL